VSRGCSPHRIRQTGILLRDQGPVAALELLPEWTRWCIDQSGIGGEHAERSLQTAIAEAVPRPSQPEVEGPFRVRELRAARVQGSRAVG
jgi:hypothetical protein